MKSVFIVTGAAGGMGKDVCERFKNYGTLIICDNDKTQLSKLKEDLNSPNDVIPCFCDVSKKEDIDALKKLTEDSGNLCGVFHFAGVSEANGNPEAIMKINLVGSVLLTEALYPLANEKTVLIHTSSMTGYMAPVIKEADELMENPLDPNFITNIMPFLNNDCNLAYYLSKRGVRRYCEKVVSMWGQKKARIISISPGVILTPMVEESMKSHADTINQMVAITPSQRMGNTTDITDLVEFLYSDKAKFITGTDIRIDGGLTPVIMNTKKS